MLDDVSDREWEGRAGAVVRECQLRLERARISAEEAFKEYQEAKSNLSRIEAEFAVAERVYLAAKGDIKAAFPTPKITLQKKEWLRLLSLHDVFGSGEMKSAAEEIGWLPTPGALRTLASDYCKIGLFDKVGRGAMRINKIRLSELAPNSMSDPAKKERELPVESPIHNPDPNEPHLTSDERERPSCVGEFDYEDDDPPF